MSASSPVPKDCPLMAAWEAYKATDDYANTKRGAGHDDQATDGSLWASFERGWRAAGGLPPFAPVVAPAPVVENRGEVPPSSTWGDLGPAAKCSRCGASAASTRRADTFNGQHILDAVTRLRRDLETARQERDAAQDKLTLALATCELTDADMTRVIEAIAERMGRAMEAECRRQIEAAEASRDAAVRAARADTWAAAAAWHEGMAESSVIPSLRPLHQQYAANFRERARLAAREGQ